MVKLRLTRLGKTHAPFYRIVAIDSRKSRDGQCLEIIGHYDPTKDPKVVSIKADRAKYWLSVGATPTETVRNLLIKYAGIEMKSKVKKNYSKPSEEQTKTPIEEKAEQV